MSLSLCHYVPAILLCLVVHPDVFFLFLFLRLRDLSQCETGLRIRREQVSGCQHSLNTRSSFRRARDLAWLHKVSNDVSTFHFHVLIWERDELNVF